MQTGGANVWAVADAHVAFENLDIWTSDRQESWRFDILNLKDKLIGTLDGVEDGSFDYSIFNTIRSSGSITWSQPEPEPGAEEPIPDWTQIRIQPWYLLQDPVTGETAEEYPLGVFIPSFPSEDLGGTGRTLSIELHDKLLILDQDKTVEAYTAHTGQLVTTLVRNILSGAGQNALSMDESTEVIRMSMTWDAGTPWLRVVNDILEAAGYFALGVDGYGTYQARKYVLPAERGLRREFIDNAESIYDDALKHDEDIFNVPNRFIATSTADGDSEAMIAVASDNTSGRFSIPTRDRVIAETEEGVEVTSQSVLNQYARRRLTEMQLVTSAYEIPHAIVPLDLNDVILLQNEKHKLKVYAVVQSYQISTEVGALQATRVREVGV